MKRVFSAILFVVVTASAFGAGPTHRYTIGVRSIPAHGVFEKEGIDLGPPHPEARPLIESSENRGTA